GKGAGTAVRRPAGVSYAVPTRLRIEGSDASPRGHGALDVYDVESSSQRLCPPCSAVPGPQNSKQAAVNFAEVAFTGTACPQEFCLVAVPVPPPLDSASLISDISVMTENTEKTVKLPSAVERFVLHWGDMGSQWGVNRSVAQIHALLYLSGRPLTAEEIAAKLGLARSNVSNSIRELMAWDLIRRVP